MKSNLEKCHLLVTSRKPVRVNIEDHIICNSREKKLLGVKIDSQLLFQSHVSPFYKKASQKLHALSKITNYMDLEKWKCFMKAFMASHFNISS